jgi:hypothetical protein
MLDQKMQSIAEREGCHRVDFIACQFSTCAESGRSTGGWHVACLNHQIASHRNVTKWLGKKKNQGDEFDALADEIGG